MYLKNISKRERLLLVYLFLFVAILLYKFIIQIYNGYPKNAWGLTEWMINYQGGFVRRGLSGEIIYQLYQVFGVDPYSLILGIGAFTYISVILFFIYFFRKKSLPLFILPFVFFLGFPILTDVWVRKDNFLILCFIGIIYLCRKKGFINLLLVNILLSVGILVHETLLFITLPILILILLNHYKKNGRNVIASFALSILSIFPSILTFLLISFYKGSPIVANQIYSSWVDVPFPITSDSDQYQHGAIMGISYGIKDGLLLVYQSYFKSPDILACVTIVLVCFLVYYILTNINSLDGRILGNNGKKVNKQNLSNVVLLQFVLCTVPLLLIGCDYGRWIYLWVCVSLVTICIIPETELSQIFPRKVSAVSGAINKQLYEFLGNSQAAIILLCLFFCMEYVRHTVTELIKTSSVYILIDATSDVLRGILFLFGLN